LAAYLGKAPYVRAMLAHGANVDCTDAHGGTALMYAARDNRVAVVQVLLEYGASVDRTDANGWSAVEYAQAHPDV
ncbi:ankyrin repeat-containing domain protein, partial [Blastocladiella britannica]